MRLFFSGQIIVFICLLCYFQLAALVHHPEERVEITVELHITGDNALKWSQHRSKNHTRLEQQEKQQQRRTAPQQKHVHRSPTTSRWEVSLTRIRSRGQLPLASKSTAGLS